MNIEGICQYSELLAEACLKAVEVAYDQPDRTSALAVLNLAESHALGLAQFCKFCLLIEADIEARKFVDQVAP